MTPCINKVSSWLIISEHWPMINSNFKEKLKNYKNKSEIWMLKDWESQWHLMIINTVLLLVGWRIITLGVVMDYLTVKGLIL